MANETRIQRVKIKASGATATVRPSTLPGIWLQPDLFVAKGVWDLFGPYVAGDLELIGVVPA